MKTSIHFLSYLAHLFVEWEMFQTEIVEKIKTRISYPFFFKENRAVYEIIWKYFVEPDRPQMTVWLMHFVCWVTKATDTLRICNTYCFPRQQWLHERDSLLGYTYIACLVLDAQLITINISPYTYDLLYILRDSTV